MLSSLVQAQSRNSFKSAIQIQEKKKNARKPEKHKTLVPANLSITVDSFFFNLIITCKYYTCPLSSFKAKQEKLKAHLQQQIHIREHKMAEVRSSVTDCKVKTVTYVLFFCFVVLFALISLL